MAGFPIQTWRGDLVADRMSGLKTEGPPYQQRVYGPFANPSRLPREQYNDGNYRGANNVRIEGEPMPVTTPYGGETDDEEGRPFIAAPHTRPEETGV